MLTLQTLVMLSDEYRWFQQSSGLWEESCLWLQASKEWLQWLVHRRFLEAVQWTQQDIRLAEEVWLSATLRPPHLELAKPTNQTIDAQ